MVDVFLPIVEAEHGGLVHLPFPGSLMEQPYMTMQIILAVQGEFHAYLSQKIEKMRTGARTNSVARPARRRR
ncbi:MAG: hypothetical protein IIZ78_23320 [Clostridiales bacterium]|nr:hypothetical protein [Clostridiales bacterium]